MKRLASLLALALLASTACEAAPFRADDGVMAKPRASRPTTASGKRTIWVDTAGRAVLSSSTRDEYLTNPNTEITVPLVQPFGSTTAGSAAVYQAIYWIPSDVTTFTLRVAMRDFLTPGALGTDTTSQSVACGQPSADRQSFVGSPTTASVTYPAYGHWVDTTCTASRDADGYVMVRWTQPTGTIYYEYAANAGQSGHTWVKSGSTDVSATSGFVATTAPAGAVALTYSTTAPRLVIWSDSIERGIADTTDCGLLSALPQLGPARGYAVAALGVPSSLMSVWAGFANWMIRDQSAVDGANVLIALGTNDAFASVTAVSMIGYTQQLIRDARALNAKRIMVSTIPPSSVFSAPKNVEIALYNSWVRSNNGWIDDVDDRAALWKDPNTPTQLLPAYSSTGGIHPKANAHAARAAAFPVLY